MKKIQAVALSTFVAVGALFTSCGGGVSSDVSLKTDIDTISYAFGANLFKQGGLDSYLMQMGVVVDTANVHYTYKRQIESDSTGTKKASLEKEMRSKIDSIVKVNNRNIAEFLKGMKSSINAPESQSAYLLGVAIGHQTGSNMFPEMIQRIYGPDSKEKINPEAFLSAIATSMKKGKYVIDNPEMLFNLKMEEIRAKEQAKQDEELKKQYDTQIEAGQKFLDENKAKEGVTALPSGLQYKVVKEGTGDKPKATDVVKVHYHGTLVDGTVFDSSVERGEPAVFNVGGVIKGWTEALQLMPVGSKWTLYIPYDLAYGSQDRGKIPPFSTLVFDVELIGIESPAGQK